MVRILMEDNGHIAKMIRDAIGVCDENRDSPNSNLVQDILDKTERRKWFLYEIMRGSRILNNSIDGEPAMIKEHIPKKPACKKTFQFEIHGSQDL